MRYTILNLESLSRGQMERPWESPVSRWEGGFYQKWSEDKKYISKQNSEGWRKIRENRSCWGSGRKTRQVGQEPAT